MSIRRTFWRVEVWQFLLEEWFPTREKSSWKMISTGLILKCLEANLATFHTCSLLLVVRKKKIYIYMGVQITYYNNKVKWSSGRFFITLSQNSGWVKGPKKKTISMIVVTSIHLQWRGNEGSIWIIKPCWWFRNPGQPVELVGGSSHLVSSQNPHLEAQQPHLGDLLTMVVNHLLVLGWSSKSVASSTIHRVCLIILGGDCRVKLHVEVNPAEITTRYYLWCHDWSNIVSFPLP